VFCACGRAFCALPFCGFQSSEPSFCALVCYAPRSSESQFSALLFCGLRFAALVSYGPWSGAHSCELLFCALLSCALWFAALLSSELWFAALLSSELWFSALLTSELCFGALLPYGLWFSARLSSELRSCSLLSCELLFSALLFYAVFPADALWAWITLTVSGGVIANAYLIPHNTSIGRISWFCGERQLAAIGWPNPPLAYLRSAGFIRSMTPSQYSRSDRSAANIALNSSRVRRKA